MKKVGVYILRNVVLLDSKKPGQLWLQVKDSSVLAGIGYTPAGSPSTGTPIKGLTDDPVEMDAWLKANTEERCYATNKRVRVNHPGAVYQFEYDEEVPGARYTPGTWLGYWPYPKTITGWQTAADAFLKTYRTRLREEKENNRTPWAETLAPIRDAYSRAQPNERAYILMRVIRYILRGS